MSLTAGFDDVEVEVDVEIEVAEVLLSILSSGLLMGPDVMGDGDVDVAGVDPADGVADGADDAGDGDGGDDDDGVFDDDVDSNAERPVADEMVVLFVVACPCLRVLSASSAGSGSTALPCLAANAARYRHGEFENRLLANDGCECVCDAGAARLLVAAAWCLDAGNGRDRERLPGG